MTSAAEQVLTTVDVAWSTALPDAIRICRWSPSSRLLAISSEGSALVGDRHKITAPMSPDPRDATWLGDRAVAIVDPVVGVVTAGLNCEQPLPFWGARCIGTHGSRTVIAGRGRLAALGHPGVRQVPEVTWTGVGVSHRCVHVGGTIWAVGGTDGLVLVDVALGCVDARLELPGVIAVAAQGTCGRLLASDLTGSVHVLELRDVRDGVELTGYRDPVRLLALSPDGRRVIAAADDEITHWAVDTDGTVADSPTSIVVHDSIITALEQSADGFVASGDDDGVVHIWSSLLAEHPVAHVHLDSEITAVAWSPDGARLAVGAVSGELVVAEVRRGALA